MKKRAALVCDASPLIFLAKIKELKLLREILIGEDGQIVVLECVVAELKLDAFPATQRGLLEDFLSGCEIIVFDESDHPSQTLSLQDRQTLNYCLKSQPDLLLTDDLKLRSIARANDLRVTGTLGVLLEAAINGHRSPKQIQNLIGDLIRIHGLRISPQLHETLRQKLDGMNDRP